MNQATAKRERIRIELPGRKFSEISNHKSQIAVHKSHSTSTELFELNSAAAHARTATRNPELRTRNRARPLHTVQKGSIILPVYRDKDGYYNGKYYIAGKRKSVRRAKLEDIKEFLALQATRLANGEIEAANLTSSDRATLQRVREILAPTGKTPELAASEYVTLFNKLNRAGITVSFEVLADDYITRASRAKIVDILCPELADRFLQAKKSNTFGKRHSGAKYLRTLEWQGEKFKAHFKCPTSQLTAVDLNTWLEKQKGSPFTRRGLRGFVSHLVAYAKAKNHLAKDWDELKNVEVPKTGRIKKAILKPEELSKLLHIASCRAWMEKMIPFIVCSAFAGVRHEEMNPEDKSKTPLDWRDIGDVYIHIGQETAKNPEEERFIKMPENLIAWLAPYRLRSGPVCKVANTSNALTRIKRLAKVKWSRGESRNAFRKSWETYNAAMKDDPEDLKQLADAAGHSQSVGRRHYRQAMYREEADRWFAILPPDREGVLALDFQTKAR